MSRIEVTASGGCQCGAVRFRVTAVKDDAHLCHCRMCQKAVGNVFAALIGVPGDALSWTRGTPAAFRSSGHAERGFCAACGTPLFYRDTERDAIALTIGSFDRPELFPPRRQDGVEGRMPWLSGLAGIGLDSTTEDDSEEWAAAIRASNRQHPDHDTSHWPPQGAEQ